MKNLAPWVTFAGCVLVVAVLYWTQAVLVPLTLAALLSFLLTPPVVWAQRRIGRVPAVVLVVTVLFGITVLGAWGIGRQVSALATDLPAYRANIRQKIADIRGAGRGGSVERIQNTLEDIKTEIEKTDAPRGTQRRPIVVASEQAEGQLWGFPSWIGPFLEPLATAGLVVVMVVFMLLEREDLRNRLIGLLGHGHLAVTTRAFDEAASRVSRYLLMQTLVNGLYGVGVGVGLWLLGVPYPLLWAALSAALRFIPYVGPWIGAGGPILISLAALPGWTRPFEVMALFAALEVVTNLVLETVLYAGAAGVSQVALIVAVAFWTWLWGSLGLLMATPLTVCLVVLGKHVQGLEFLATLMADRPALAPDAGFYQRLLARDHIEAAEILERQVKAHGPESAYDALMVPALNYAERDRIEQRLSTDEEQAIWDATRELTSEVETALGNVRPAAPRPPAAPSERVPVLAYAGSATSDELALRMLASLVDGTAVRLEVAPARLLVSELMSLLETSGSAIVCIADLPPSPPSKTRYLVKKLRAARPDLRIVVGRWAPPALADDSVQALVDAGADHVATTLVDTRDQLQVLAQHLPRPAADARELSIAERT